MLSKKVMVVGLTFLSACNQPDDGIYASDSVLKERASRLPLSERYGLYQKVFDRERPPNTVLAESVASLGRPAFEYAVKKAKQGNSSEISAAIEIIGIQVEASKVPCAIKDVHEIDRNVLGNFTSKKTAAIVTQRVQVACSLRMNVPTAG